jgi:hypothetical protein
MLYGTHSTSRPAEQEQKGINDDPVICVRASAPDVDLAGEGVETV